MPHPSHCVQGLRTTRPSPRQTGQVDEIMNEDLHEYLAGIGRHCEQIHAAALQTFVLYPIETALPA